MAIVKMSFVSSSTDQAHYEEMLRKAQTTSLLHPELASTLVNEDNGGVVLKEDNVYAGYVSTLTNISHSIGYDIDDKQEPSKTYTDAEIESFVQEVDDQFKVLTDLGENASLTEEDKDAIEKLRVLDFESIDSCQYISFFLGRIPKESMKKLDLVPSAKFVVAKVQSNATYDWICVSCGNSYVKETKKTLDGLFFEEIKIPTVDSKKIIAKYSNQLGDVLSYCKKRDEIFKLHPYVAIYNGQYTLAGFVPAKEVEAYKAIYKDIPNMQFEVKKPNEVPNLTPPTQLKNNWFFRPFELFVEMYSLPGYTDMDPTVFFGITYCLLFGIMFGDLGQGALLLVGGLVLEKLKHNKLCGIIGRVGITSMVFGFLFGSVFGNEHLLNPIHESLFHVREKLFDVMASSSTMTLLIGAVMIGAVLILVTMLINISQNIKHKKWGEVWFSQNGVAGFIFYSYLILAVGNMMMGFMPNILIPPLMIPFIGIPVICFLMKEPFTQALEGGGLKPHQGWGGFFVESFFECFEIALSFVTNSMSYLRVGGFVLSHAGMMLVVMTLVEMTGNAGPIVMVLGNLFVMGLEGLVVGIQTLRLEYYEMFSRYYTGGGKRFTLITENNG